MGMGHAHEHILFAVRERYSFLSVINLPLQFLIKWARGAPVSISFIRAVLDIFQHKYPEKLLASLEINRQSQIFRLLEYCLRRIFLR